MQNAFSATFSTEGRVVGPCWEKLSPKGPEGIYLRRGGDGDESESFRLAREMAIANPGIAPSSHMRATNRPLLARNEGLSRRVDFTCGGRAVGTATSRSRSAPCGTPEFGRRGEGGGLS